MTELLEEFRRKQSLIEQQKGVRNKLLQEKTIKEEVLEDNRKKLELYKTCVNTFQKIYEILTNRTKLFFERAVTEALNITFPSIEQKALIEYKKRGNSIETNFLVEKKVENDFVISDPKRGRGGGITDIYAFALRLVMLVKSIPPLTKILILDEVFKFVSPGEYSEEAAKFLKYVSEKFGIQIILVTHSNEYTTCADKVFYMTHDGDKTIVKED